MAERMGDDITIPMYDTPLDVVHSWCAILETRQQDASYEHATIVIDAVLCNGCDRKGDNTLVLLVLLPAEMHEVHTITATTSIAMVRRPGVRIHKRELSCLHFGMTGAETLSETSLGVPVDIFGQSPPVRSRSVHVSASESAMAVCRLPFLDQGRI